MLGKNFSEIQLFQFVRSQIAPLWICRGDILLAINTWRQHNSPAGRHASC